MNQESRDANFLLNQLKIGLQSSNMGIQSESVVKFNALFQRYPLPVLIDSACLKLAEAFRCGSNFIRIQICEVFERNQSHLDKIYSVEDFFRNLFTVTTSNDPIARSITLLTLGHIAPIIPNHKSIHHCISSSFETATGCELNATIACAASYVKFSSEFACNIVPKIVSIIDSDKSSIETKIRALSVLDHQFYNANDAMSVRSFLIDVIGNSKITKLICACSTLSTRIAFTSLSHISLQIEFLLAIFHDDPRPIIRANALKNMLFLAKKSPHIWETTHFAALVTNLENALAGDITENDDYQIGSILMIFCELLTCECNFISQDEKNRLFKLCYQLSLDDQNLTLRSMAFELLTVMSEENYYSSSADIVDCKPKTLDADILSAMKAFLTQTKPTRCLKHINKRQPDKSKSARSIYRNLTKLCRTNSHYCPELVKLIFDRISNRNTSLVDLSPYHTELMCAILQYSSKTPLSADGCWELIKSKASNISDANLLNLCVLYFQTICTMHVPYNFPGDFIDKVTGKHDSWLVYKIMRQAMRYGHFEVASLLCNHLHQHVTSDTIDFYFRCLGRVCNAENILRSCEDNLEANLKKAIAFYEDSMSPMRAAIGHSRTTNFQLQFLWLRIRTLQSHSELFQCCRIYDVSPMTYATLLLAIGAIRGPPCDQEIVRFGIIQQMPKIAKDFRYVSKCYENLAQVSFDCDNRTLDYLSLLKSGCIIMADCIDSIFQHGKNLPIISKLPSGKSDNIALEHTKLTNTCTRLIEQIKSEIVKPGLFPSQKSIEPIINLLRTSSEDLLKCHFVYPRYFFQPMQETHIKLAISPQPSSTSSSINLLINNNLVLKVEGLIESVAKARILIRSICKVVISVGMSNANDSMTSQFIQSTTTPHNNYFRTEFLLPLKLVGTFNIDIDVSLVDENEQLWKTGPKERLTVIVS